MREKQQETGTPETYVFKDGKLKVAVERLTSGKIGYHYHGVEHDISLVAGELKTLSSCLNEVREKAKHLMGMEVFNKLEMREKLLTTALQAVQQRPAVAQQM